MYVFLLLSDLVRDERCIAADNSHLLPPVPFSSFRSPWLHIYSTYKRMNSQIGRELFLLNRGLFSLLLFCPFQKEKLDSKVCGVFYNAAYNFCSGGINTRKTGVKPLRQQPVLWGTSVLVCTVSSASYLFISQLYWAGECSRYWIWINRSLPRMHTVSRPSPQADAKPLVTFAFLEIENN